MIELTMHRRLVVLGLISCAALVAMSASPDASRDWLLAQEQATPSPGAGTRLPDLVVAAASSELEWNGRCWDDGPHESIIDVQVANNGNAPAAAFVVQGEDGHPTPVPWVVEALAAGESRWLGLRRGGARVLIVDPADAVVESNESNNRLERMPTFVLTQPPTCSPTPPPAAFLPDLRR